MRLYTCSKSKHGIYPVYAFTFETPWIGLQRNRYWDLDALLIPLRQHTHFGLQGYIMFITAAARGVPTVHPSAALAEA